MAEVDVFENIMKRNEEQAEKNKKIIGRALCINIMSSPGAGKTTILERTVERLKKKYKIAVIEGDIATSNDANRIKKFKVPVYQIKTENYGGGCHLDADMVNTALKKINAHRKKYDIIIIENVGNLICPADFSLGEDRKVVVLSVTEGEDKPLKYPLMFQIADAMLLNKIDLVPHLDFNQEELFKNIKKINSKLSLIRLSASHGTYMENWEALLDRWIKEKKWRKKPSH